MDHEKYFEDCLKFFDKDEVRFQLITASTYITAYDLLIDTIIRKIEEFYIDGYDENGLKIGKRYQTEVRELYKKDIVIASTRWLVKYKVITKSEMERIKIFRKHRNELAHELTKMISDSDANTKTEFMIEIRDLNFKIHKWWFIEYEMPANPYLDKYNSNELNYDKVLVMQMLPMENMIKIANDEIKKRTERKNAQNSS